MSWLSSSQSALNNSNSVERKSDSPFRLGHAVFVLKHLHSNQLASRLNAQNTHHVSVRPTTFKYKDPFEDQLCLSREAQDQAQPIKHTSPHTKDIPTILYSLLPTTIMSSQTYQPHPAEVDSAKTVCKCGGADSVCGCAPGECTCASCGKSSDPVNKAVPVEGSSKTVCKCGGNDGTCVSTFKRRVSCVEDDG